MKILVIESPGKVKKLKAILGDGWEIVPSIGHIDDLPEHEIGVVPPDFKPTYVLSERGTGVIARLAASIRSGDDIFLGTDPDREGESISWHLARALGLDIKTTKRVAFNQVTEAAVLKAVASPRRVDTKLVAAQEARRVIDRLVGYLVSPELSHRSGVRSAGRVQSVAVRIVVDRERQICAFVSTRHFGVTLGFLQGEQSWTAAWQVDPALVTDENPYLTNRSLPEQIAGLRRFTVLSCDDAVQRRAPPAPFITSSLQQAASVKLGVRPEQAMEAAQALYEQGHITYHRTDDPNLADDAMAPLRTAADAMGLTVIPARRPFPVKEGAQSGHPAITPTHWDVVQAGKNEVERALYTLIRLQAIGSQLEDAHYARRTVVLETTLGDEQKIRFEAKARIQTEQGWMKLAVSDFSGDAAVKGEEGVDNAVPLLAPGSTVLAVEGAVTTSDTKPPGRYTPASLIGKLETEGLGRPSTYAGVMKTIEEHGYVETGSDGKIRPLKDGEVLVDALKGRFGFMELDFTRHAEDDFDRIAGGAMRYIDCVRAFHQTLAKEIEAFAIAVPQRPSETMLDAVKARAKRLNAAIPTGAATNREICAAFLGPYQPRPEGGKGPGSTRLASEKQIAILEKLVAENRIPKPLGFPDTISAKDAYEILNRAFKKSRRK